MVGMTKIFHIGGFVWIEECCEEHQSKLIVNIQTIFHVHFTFMCFEEFFQSIVSSSSSSFNKTCVNKSSSRTGDGMDFGMFVLFQTPQVWEGKQQNIPRLEMLLHSWRYSRMLRMRLIVRRVKWNSVWKDQSLVMFKMKWVMFVCWMDWNNLRKTKTCLWWNNSFFKKGIETCLCVIHVMMLCSTSSSFHLCLKNTHNENEMIFISNFIKTHHVKLVCFFCINVLCHCEINKISHTKTKEGYEMNVKREIGCVVEWRNAQLFLNHQFKTNERQRKECVYNGSENRMYKCWWMDDNNTLAFFHLNWYFLWKTIWKSCSNITIQSMKWN